jgi:hypothetical protein
MLGGAATPQTPAKPKNTDYGLYTYGSGILSLGSFWYPSLAVRQNRKWVDEAPQGLGDVAYSEMSDFDVRFNVPPGVTIAATSTQPVSATQTAVFSSPQRARLRLSDERRFTVKSKEFPPRRQERVGAVLHHDANCAKADKAIDIADALCKFSKRLALIRTRSKVVEGRCAARAGGMEYSA